MQEIRIIGPPQRSIYYSVMRIFADTNPHQSILFMRLVNSFIASLILFGLLKFTTGRTRIAAIFSLTLTLVPVAVRSMSSINPHGWADISVMTSWAFLHGFLSAPKSDNRKKILFVFYIFSASLAATTRVDATTYTVFTSSVVLLHHFVSRRRISRNDIIALIGISAVGIAVIGFSQHVRNYLTFPMPTGYAFGQYLLFQITHIPESLVVIFGYNVGQDGSGPGIVGIIGLSLFVLGLSQALQTVTKYQLPFVFLILAFLTVVMFKGSVIVASLVPLPGTYALGLITFLLGMSIITSRSEQQFLSRKGNRIAAISLLSITHALTLYSWMELYTQGNQASGFFNAQTLDPSSSLSLSGGWWWNNWSSPNWVFLIGVTSFPVFLHYAWRIVNSDSVLRNSSDFNVSDSVTKSPLISIT